MNKQEHDFLASFRTGADLNEGSWVCWKHIVQGISHCDTCLKLDECWFQNSKKPKLPQHVFCHCKTTPILYNEVIEKATSFAPYSKFDPYLFDPENFYKHGKGHMLNSWGYTVSDSVWLKKEVEKQGLEQYIRGEYELGRLDEQGQRISIRIEIPNRTEGGTISFVTGWMVRPNGQITLNTPYGGK